jgi:hypothetical protein
MTLLPYPDRLWGPTVSYPTSARESSLGIKWLERVVDRHLQLLLTLRLGELTLGVVLNWAQEQLD